MRERTARNLALLGAVLVMLGLLTGFGTAAFANPRMGVASHLEGLMNGTLLLALAATWHRVALSPRLDQAAFWLLAFGSLANWAATLLAAIWGAGGETMPIAAAGHHASAAQEAVVTGLLVSLSFAMLGALALVIKGLLAGRTRTD